MIGIVTGFRKDHPARSSSGTVASSLDPLAAHPSFWEEPVWLQAIGALSSPEYWARFRYLWLAGSHPDRS